MTSKTPKRAVSDALSDLTQEKLEEFHSALLDRREEPRVRRRAIEGKSIIQITDVLVETFTEDGAVEVTLNVLKEIDCNKVAQELGMSIPTQRCASGIPPPPPPPPVWKAKPQENSWAQVKSYFISMLVKREKYQEFEQKYKEVFQDNKKVVVATEKQIRADIEMLHQFLREEEEARLADLREEEEQKADVVRREMKNIQEQISFLSDNISAAEQEMQEPSGSLVIAECPEPQLVSGMMIDVTKHLGNLTYRVWEKMKEKVKFTPVILDPNTANPWLCLSDDLTSVRNTLQYVGTSYQTKKRQLPDNPERFSKFSYVLGSEGFSSGKHSWEVEVGDHDYWHIGVAKETVDRKDPTKYFTYCSLPKRGYWAVHYMEGKYMSGWKETIPVQRNLQKIRVQLDYEKGEVSFYDPEDMTHIYTHEDLFTEKLYPFIYIARADGDKLTDIRVCQSEISVTIQ